MSEKLDGIRGIWDGKNLYTKKGNKIYAPKKWLKDFPSFALDGELWLDYHSLEKTASVVLDKKPNVKQWSAINYYIFDVPKICDSCSLLERLEKLQVYLKQNPNQRIKIIPQFFIKNEKNLEEYFEKIVKKGGEGLILRNNLNPNIAYKYKPYDESKCEVVGYVEGKGKNKGKMGSILCKGMIEGREKVIKIGSGFMQKERENPPKLQSIIAYKHNGYTKNGLPKFPVFLKLEYNE